MSISNFGPSLSSFNSLQILFIHSAFSAFVFSQPYFSPQSFGFFCIWLLVCFCVISSQLLIKFFFFVVLKYPVLSVTLCWYLFNLPSFANTFWFISLSWTVIFPCVDFSFLFQHIPAFFFCFIILACFRRFFSAFPIEFRTMVFIFSSCFLRSSFSHKLSSPLHRLVYLIRLYYSLICKVVIDVFYSFLS